MLVSSVCAADHLSVYESNPRYLEWRGKPVVLIGSGEHYGALINLDFDYRRYFKQLQKDGLNITRVFAGASYVEPVGAFNIERNTLAPLKGRYLAPWAIAKDGKWDLDGWNEAYFDRLRDLMTTADQAGVVVEFNLFCPFYPSKHDKAQSDMWPLSPFHPDNHVNDVGQTPHEKVYSLEADPRLLAAQEKFVKRVVSELKDADNVYYEICNEPYFGGVTMQWQHRMADVISAAQESHEKRKIISFNIANHSASITDLHPDVALFNFHYTYPPVAVEQNWALNKAIGNNETGFRGTGDDVYRNEAWDWMLAGGASFNHLDYSFAAGHEDGSFAFPATQPGGGGPVLRSQLAALAQFMGELDFAMMKPGNDLVTDLPKEVSLRLLAGPAAWAGYLHHSKAGVWKKSGQLQHGQWRDSFSIKAEDGKYHVEWIDPKTGETLEQSVQNDLRLQTPVYATDIAFRIHRTKE